ncbi:MAG: hypothetical protein RLZZ230_691 [Candidatus Parcubacteria bacterium]|jgi:hypothetical protein
MSIKKIFIIVSVVVIIGSVVFIGKFSGDYKKEKFIVPETVDLYLQPAFNESEGIQLLLNAPAGDGCDRVSNLDISKGTKEGTLFVTINGYSIEEYVGNGGCIAMLKPASIKINIDEFLQSGGRQVYFKMDEKESSYKLIKDAYAIYFEPIKVTNVISDGLNSIHQEPQSIALILNTEKFAVLGLNGSFRDMDYNPQLRAVAKAKGLTIVDEIYKGFTNQEGRGLWVIAEDSQIPDTVPAIIDEITYDSSSWGLETVSVTISRSSISPTYEY